MNTLKLIILISAGFSTFLNGYSSDPVQERTREGISGFWIRYSSMGPLRLEFKQDGIVEGDLWDDQSIEIKSAYTISGDTIRFTDLEGVACPEPGSYKMHSNDYYLALDLIDDNCGGRVKSTMGFWVRPDFEKNLEALSAEISSSSDPEAFLNRARMYMAIGKSYEAGQDLDRFILVDSSQARVYINRAATRFPTDLAGVIRDCDKALELDPKTRNAFFLRGLARYQLGKQELACKDFYRAIELGFTVLKEAEKERCMQYWSSYTKQ